MWHLKFSRRDFIEFWLAGAKKSFGKARPVSYVETGADEDSVHAYWKDEPTGEYFFPSTIVALPSVFAQIFTALNSSPTASLPVSAYSRIVLSNEAQDHFSPSLISFSNTSIAAVVALSMAESMLHSDGKIGVRQLSSAACKRTLAYAWGKALSAKTSSSSFEKLADRWFETYCIINSQSPLSLVRETIYAESGPLTAYAQIAIGLPPSSDAGNLAYVLHRKVKGELSAHWTELSKAFGFNISLESFSKSTREERGAYLQQALVFASSTKSEMAAALCAFIATQVAPGSLEHLELLRQSGKPEIVFWYALYAAIQTPNEIMAAQAGLGYRVYRDISQTEDQLAPPTADIAFEELKALERTGIDSFSKTFGHVSEVEVELMPLVTASFSYSSKLARASRQMPGQTGQTSQSDYDRSAYSRGIDAHRKKLEQAISLLSQLANEIHEGDDGYKDSMYRRTHKKKI